MQLCNLCALAVSTIADLSAESSVCEPASPVAGLERRRQR